nr:hypothetical protein [Candidatus Sigynarchaeota archaeon]
MTCICLENGKCVIEEFILEGSSCLPEQAINPPESVLKAAREKMAKEKKD